MILRFGRFGPFLGCSTYPKCRGIVNIPKKGEAPPEDMPSCPAIGCDGKMAQRRSRFGKPFFSCSNYPACDVIVSNLDDLAEKYPHHPKTAYVKKAKKWEKKEKGKKEKKPTKKISQPSYTLSKELQAVVDAQELSRPEVTKKIWEYIKAHDLQDPKNKRRIIPDAKLAKVFGSKEPLDMMQLSRVLNKHFKK
jgi:DNA topoisomerase-1